MRYSLKQLAVFDAVADFGSVSAAAEQLALTQSATSMSLAQLEKMLGRPLFERQGKQMALTHWGMWLRPKAKRLLQDAQQIEMGFYDQHLLSGEIRLGASQTPAEHLVPDLISIIDSDFPEIRIELGVRSTQSVIEGILDYKYDLGIIEGRCDDNRIHQEVWCRDHLCVVASAHHPFAKREVVSLAQLEQAKWVLREQGSGTRGIFDSAIHKLIADLDVWREYEHVPVLRSLVANGSYLTCLPYLDVERFIQSGQLVALNVPQLSMERTLSFIWRAEMAENPLAECIRREGLRMMKGKPYVL
ncbi:MULTISPECIES: LysR substrate-binding domain-containing protein [Vibrio]|uniref:LysR substrate-binding domain-containing protein n=1 Tax=Vibrio TaxID=662 RepID=UPI000C164A3F|nr:LysR substrate-binding domain-containing protein [Vibrio fujianensis]NAW70180.1 LysR family transcriptional regulator [Vibrio sp. V28_P6S34P95]NAX05555.1 LysR family transcriptional regulator [Vibrio sp. V30_P3S12P165]NAX35398.1 LysR family transcriptional regulator [Vibrio sp. V29_P1S30P107]NAX37967.1 LysR family transcriptional regulator [Vibrio sp. V27_P1S3P104]NAX40658.1 LysR family transcriptional regulator [Vibrio sp. V26_P1S5P106]NNN45219.1 LysR family transcriptional regulator [Vib